MPRTALAVAGLFATMLNQAFPVRRVRLKGQDVDSAIRLPTRRSEHQHQPCLLRPRVGYECPSVDFPRYGHRSRGNHSRPSCWRCRCLGRVWISPTGHHGCPGRPVGLFPRNAVRGDKRYSLLPHREFVHLSFDKREFTAFLDCLNESYKKYLEDPLWDSLAPCTKSPGLRMTFGCFRAGTQNASPASTPTRPSGATSSAGCTSGRSGLAGLHHKWCKIPVSIAVSVWTVLRCTSGHVDARMPTSRAASIHTGVVTFRHVGARWCKTPSGRTHNP